MQWENRIKRGWARAELQNQINVDLISKSEICVNCETNISDSLCLHLLNGMVRTTKQNFCEGKNGSGFESIQHFVE